MILSLTSLRLQVYLQDAIHLEPSKRASQYTSTPIIRRTSPFPSTSLVSVGSGACGSSLSGYTFGNLAPRLWFGLFSLPDTVHSVSPFAVLALLNHTAPINH